MIPAYDTQAQDWALEAYLTQGVLWRRFAAWWLDLLLIGILVAALWFVLALFGVLTFGLGFHLMALLPVVPFLYHAGFLASAAAATPGQAALGLIVVRNDDFGRPELLQAVVFTLLFYLTMAVGFLLFLVALFTTRHRALHDLGAGLVIVRKRALTEMAPRWNMPGYA